MVKTSSVNTVLLDQAIADSGLKIGFIVEKLGITRQAFDRKRKGLIAFRKAEVYVLRDLLQLDDLREDEIFFPEKLGDRLTGAPV